jgi:acyl-CoA dehydrogenase
LHARFVLEHRLSAQDPLEPNEGAWEPQAAEMLLSDQSASVEVIAKLLA